MVIFAGVGFVDDADAVGLEQPKLLKSGAARRHNSLMTGWDADRHAEVKKLVLAGFELVGGRGAQIQPLTGMGLRYGAGVIVVVFDENFGH